MKTTVELIDIISVAKETGVLGWIKIKDASKVVSNTSGTYSIATTIYIQNYVQKEKSDEIIMFGKKQLNITKLQKDLKKYIGLEVSIFIGGILFNGILSNTCIHSIKRELEITDADIATMFNYANTNSYSTSSAKKRYESGLVSFYKLIKSKQRLKLDI